MAAAALTTQWISILRELIKQAQKRDEEASEEDKCITYDRICA